MSSYTFYPKWIALSHKIKLSLNPAFTNVCYFIILNINK